MVERLTERRTGLTKGRGRLTERRRRLVRAKEMKGIIVTGSRYWSNKYKILGALADYLDCDEYKLFVGDAKGADAMARDIWTGEKQVFVADWNKYGRAAGPIRNKDDTYCNGTV